MKKNLITATAILATSTLGFTQESAAPAKTDAERASGWKRTAALGATVTGGNSDTLLVTANVNAIKKWTENELSLGADAAYGEVDDKKNADTLHGFTQYNRLFTERFFGYARLDALHDGIASVQYRFTLGPGAGYYLIKNDKTSLSVEAGPSFITERVGHQDSSYFALRLAERLEHKLSDRARIWQSVEILPQVDEWENYIVNAEVGVDTKITNDLSLRVFVQDTYDNQPAAGRKKNDVKLVSAIAYQF